MADAQRRLYANAARINVPAAHGHAGGDDSNRCRVRARPGLRPRAEREPGEGRVLEGAGHAADAPMGSCRPGRSQPGSSRFSRTGFVVLAGSVAARRHGSRDRGGSRLRSPMPPWDLAVRVAANPARVGLVGLDSWFWLDPSPRAVTVHETEAGVDYDLRCPHGILPSGSQPTRLESV